LVTVGTFTACSPFVVPSWASRSGTFRGRYKYADDAAIESGVAVGAVGSKVKSYAVENVSDEGNQEKDKAKRSNAKKNHQRGNS